MHISLCFRDEDGLVTTDGFPVLLDVIVTWPNDALFGARNMGVSGLTQFTIDLFNKMIQIYVIEYLFDRM